jgi:DNA invertase Pin-like site-specific DNA recombinase
VSTKKQGVSGLGLQAQQDAVNRYIAPELIDFEFTEVETGTNKKHRPVLAEALELCKKHDATLLIAKLDRLARNVHFVSSLLESKVKFKAVDFPDANELTIHILSAIAQHEQKIISERITSALAVKKQQLAKVGQKLGTPTNLKPHHKQKGIDTIKSNAVLNANTRQATAFLMVLNVKSMSLVELATLLNKSGFKTAKNKEYTPTAVRRLLIRNKLGNFNV